MIPTFPLCKLDFVIWDIVLGRRPGWRLETISRIQDGRDYQIMLQGVRRELIGVVYDLRGRYLGPVRVRGS